MKPHTLALGVAASVLLATAASAADRPWATSWGASPQAPTAATGPFPGSPTFHDQTIRQVIRLSGGGRQVRIRFTNEYGTAPVTIGAAHLARAAVEGGAIQPGSDHVLTFAGKPTAVIPPGAPLLSDPVDMPVQPLTRLSVSLYLPGQVSSCTCHGASAETGYVAAGDASGAAAMPGAVGSLLPRAMISAVDVAPDKPAKTIVAFGDSITDGVGATVGADKRWPDQFAERLLAAGGSAVYVSDQGISGNRVLNDGFGVNALARFDRDVLATPGLAYVIVFEGINDIGISFMPRDQGGPLADFIKNFAGAPVTAEDIIGGYRQMIARAHARGVKVYGATITPYEGAGTDTPAGEQVRQTVNAWIRAAGNFDGVLDFDAVWRDPAHPTRIREGFHAGDHLHGSDAGYRALAASIDLSLFK
jgi:lysophospholipase L1-like esterase